MIFSLTFSLVIAQSPGFTSSYPCGISSSFRSVQLLTQSHDVPKLSLDLDRTPRAESSIIIFPKSGSETSIDRMNAQRRRSLDKFVGRVRLGLRKHVDAN